MSLLKITKRKVKFILSGPKDILPCPIQETINVNMTFQDLLDKVLDHNDELPPGLLIDRSHGGSSPKTPNVSLSYRIKDFLETHYKREMPIYRVRLSQPKPIVVKKSGPSETGMKGTVCQRKSPRFTAARPPSISACEDADEASIGGLEEDEAPNENPENVPHPSQGLSGAEDEASSEVGIEGSWLGEAAPNEDPMEAEAVGAATVLPNIFGGNAAQRKAVVALEPLNVARVSGEVGFEEEGSPEVEILDEVNHQVQLETVVGEEENSNVIDPGGVPCYSRVAQSEQVMDDCPNTGDLIQGSSQDSNLLTPPPIPMILAPPPSLRSTPISSVVSVPVKFEFADWESESVLEDLRQDGVKITDVKSQSHRRLAGVSNTLLLLAIEEKRKLKEKWQSLYGRAPVCARLLEELLKE